ncbi:hypothetical protein F2Q68_00013852 [Brassica cretica]|uniref:Uncharacterized protein n=1 Tax=Brassica cretica TaxID=69181 RepID=A0A8S9HCB5_BRACR|nr:hypothetical protein F2Q68_00013852 [Brassica cretica]
MGVRRGLHRLQESLGTEFEDRTLGNLGVQYLGARRLEESGDLLSSQKSVGDSDVRSQSSGARVGRNSFWNLGVLLELGSSLENS